MAKTITNFVRTHLRAGLGSNAVGNNLADSIDMMESAGVVPHLLFNLSVQPTAADTMTIGTDVYEFQAAAADLAADTNIAVLIGADAAASLVNLVAAINAADADNAHASIFQTDSTTAALANGTEDVVAVIVGTKAQVFYADRPGGGVKAGAPSIACSMSMTSGSNKWVEATAPNLGTYGVEPGPAPFAATRLTVLLGMMDEPTREIHFGFPVKYFQVTKSNAGEVKIPGSGDLFDISANGITLTWGSGTAPDIEAGDILDIVAFG